MTAIVQRCIAAELAEDGWQVETEMPTGRGRRRCDVLAWHPGVPALLVVEAKADVDPRCARVAAVEQVNQYVDDFESRGWPAMGLVVGNWLREDMLMGAVSVAAVHRWRRAIWRLGMVPA